jgi:hypothetical protein
MVFNAIFNTISIISWRSVLLGEETGENHRPVAQCLLPLKYRGHDRMVPVQSVPITTKVSWS